MRSCLLPFFIIATSLAAGFGPPTFYKDVLPILADRCQACHRTGQSGPMPLTSFKETRPWAKAIREAVASRRMPPWHADSSVLPYANDLSLTEAQRKTLIEWIDAGVAEGDPKDAAKPRVFAAGWRIAEPDAVFSMPQSFEVPASGTLEYQYFTVHTNFSEDRWIEMAEVRPSAPAVVHHAIVSMRATRDHGWFGGQFLAGYAPGAAPQIWKPGVARLLPAGADLVFQMHYTSNGKPASDRTQIGLVFAKSPPQEMAVAMRAVNSWFTIPPRDANYRVEASATMRQQVKLAAIRPHMHLRGKSFEMRAVFPDKTSKVVLRVPKYDFHWQPYYYLQTPIVLPPGTVLECVAYFDNSANNPRNPDPNETVTWGEQSWEEMMIGWFDILVPTDGAAPFSSAALR